MARRAVLATLGRLAELAERQNGQVTREQTHAAGVQVEELIGAGLAEPVTDHVLRLRAGARPSHPLLHASWLQLAPATPAWQRTPPTDGVASGETALELYGVAGEGAPQAEFTIANTDAVVVDASTALRVAHLRDNEWTRVDGIPVTSPARTLIDLNRWYDLDELARKAGSLVALRWTTATHLRATLAHGLPNSLVRGNHQQWLDAVLAEVDQAHEEA